MNIPAQTIGRGVLSLSRGLTAELFSDLLTIDDCTVQGELKARGIFEQIHARLLLPDSYTILGIFYTDLMHCYRGEWSILIASPDIPLTDEGSEYPSITPVYRRNADGTTHLVRIDISR